MSTEERDGDTIAARHLAVVRRKTEVCPRLDLLPTRTVQLLLKLREHGEVETVAQEVRLQVPVCAPIMGDVMEKLLEEEIGDVRRAKVEEPGAMETLIHLKSHHQRQVTTEQPLVEQEGPRLPLKDRLKEDTRFPRRK